MLNEPQLIAAQSRVDKALWGAGFAEGRAMGLEKAVEYALSEEEPDRSTARVPELSPPVEPMGNLTSRERGSIPRRPRAHQSSDLRGSLYLGAYGRRPCAQDSQEAGSPFPSPDRCSFRGHRRRYGSQKQHKQPVMMASHE
jgi:hypothetical protein